MKKERSSKNGYYCGYCNKYLYKGYDSRDKVNLPSQNAICVECGDKYTDKGSKKK